MKAKDYLNQLVKLDTIIQNKLVEKALWKDVALGITAHSEGDRVQSSGSQQKMANAVERCVDLEREINHLVDCLIDIKQGVIRTIELLNATEYDVLHKRYIQNMTFEEIGTAKGKSKSWATTVHGRALQNVQRILDAQEQDWADDLLERLESL